MNKPTQLPQTQKTLSATDEIGFGQVLRTLWRGKFWILICCLLSLGGGIYYSYFVAVPLYTANASVTFESRKSQTLGDLESVVGGLGGDLATINTEVEVLRSRGLIEKMVNRLSLIDDPEFNVELRPEPQISIDKLIGMVRGSGPIRPEPNPQAVLDATIDLVSSKVVVSNVRQSFVLRITVATQNAEKSALLANTLAALYILDQLEVKFEATEQATEWLTNRVGQLQVELEEAVEAVKDFNASSQLGSAEELVALNRQIKDLRERSINAAENLTSAQEKLAALIAVQETQDNDQMATLAKDRPLTRLLEMLNSGTTSDSTAFVTRFNQILDRAKVDVQRAEAQATALQNSVLELEQQTTQQSADLVKLQQLEREAEASRLIYEYFLGRLKETSVQQGIQQADSRVLSKAAVPHFASAPRKSVIMALSVLLGLLFGAGTTVLRELSQNTIRTPEELEALTGHTVLGQIPSIPARRRANVLKYLSEKPTSAAAEAVRNLRTSTLLSNVDHPPQVIMSTSSLPGEGKTTQSLSMAQNLSGLGKKILLIEGDIRRRVFAEYFDIKGKKGLLAVLSGDAPLSEVAVYNEQLGADILVGEKSKVNAADVFSSDSFTEFLRHAREIYDYIIIDTPPVLVVPDARVIGQSVDAILYTVKWDQTTKRQISEGLKSFESVNLKVTGLVLGQINARGMKRYGYGDGTYGKYGRGYYDN